MNQEEIILLEGLKTLNLTCATNTVQTLIDYVALLSKWNQVYNLTAIRETPRMMRYHVLDSLAPLSYLPQETSTLLDVGSGGGMPGILWAIAKPEWQVTLLDSNQKKTAFLRQAVMDLGLPNVQVVTLRVEDFEVVEKFDIITSRAFSDLQTFVTLTHHLLKTEGYYAALKGVNPLSEIDALPKEMVVTKTVSLAVPGIDAERHLILIKKSG